MSLSNIQKTPNETVVKSHTEVVENTNNEFVQRTVPRTLGFNSLNTVVSALASGFSSFNTVVSSLTNSGNSETLVFKNGASTVGTVYITWSHLNWTISTASPINYLLLESGDFFLLEDGTSKILLE